MNITDYLDYKKYLKALIATQPKKGYGISRKLALHLSVNSVVISQILSGAKHFTAEQALQVADFFYLTETEKEYLILLVQLERSGTTDLRNFFSEKIKKIQIDSKTLKGRHKTDRELDETQKAQYYSNWYYSAVRMLISIPKMNTIKAISDYLRLPPSQVREILEFLLKVELITEVNGNYSIGSRFTLITRDSPFVNNHRRNWRLKALENLTYANEHTVHISAPYSISTDDYEWIQKKIMSLIEEASKRISTSKPETLACLNIDWFKF